VGIRTGLEYRDRLRDGRTVYVNGERVKDVTTYPPFQRTVDTIAALYDLQHDPAHLDLSLPSLLIGGSSESVPQAISI
jgi:4-hydroxyphenylacetate 3-monooxygenase